MTTEERTPYVPGTLVRWPRRFKRNTALDIARITHLLAYLSIGIVLFYVVVRVIVDLRNMYILPGQVNPFQLISRIETPLDWADYILSRVRDLFAGITGFVTLKATSLGLYMLTEADYNIHDPEEAQP